MGKRSFDFSAPGRAGNRAKVLRAIAVFILVFGCLHFECMLPDGVAAESARLSAAPSPLASPSPLLSEQEFLNLPAFDIEAESAAAKTRVGDTLSFRVPGADAGGSVTIPEGSPEVATLQNQGWTIGSAEKKEGAKADLSFSATPLKPGNLSLPSLPIRDASGKAIARTNPYSLQVESAIKAQDQNPSEPAPARPPVELPFPWWVLVAGGVLALALLAGIVYGVNRVLKKSRKPEPAKVESPRPEDEIALQALREVELQGWAKRGNFKVHYFRTSEILKAYIGARYEFDAKESTSREILATLDQRKIFQAPILDPLENLFSRLDLVKFTDHVPSPEDASKALNDAIKFVTITKRRVSIPTDPGKAGT